MTYDSDTIANARGERFVQSSSLTDLWWSRHAMLFVLSTSKDHMPQSAISFYPLSNAGHLNPSMEGRRMILMRSFEVSLLAGLGFFVPSQTVCTVCTRPVTRRIPFLGPLFSLFVHALYS